MLKLSLGSLLFFIFSDLVFAGNVRNDDIKYFNKYIAGEYIDARNGARYWISKDKIQKLILRSTAKSVNFKKS